MTESCKRLWIAVLEQAINDLKRGYSHSHTARTWFQSDREDVGSFFWICGLLGIDPESRKKILVQSHLGPLMRRATNVSFVANPPRNVIVTIDGRNHFIARRS